MHAAKLEGFKLAVYNLNTSATDSIKCSPGMQMPNMLYRNIS